jgi:hypothetical protein
MACPTGRVVISFTSLLTITFLSLNPDEQIDTTTVRGLLERSTARYFYKRLKTCLHKPTGNLLEILVYRKCTFENCLQFFINVFVSNKHSALK